MTQLLFKLRDNSPQSDKIATLDEIAQQYENTPVHVPTYELKNIYEVNIKNVDQTTINQLVAMAHIEFCELPACRQSIY
jgi:hypothetical protein